MPYQLQEDAHRVITFLADHDQEIALHALAERLGLDQAKVSAICQGFAEDGWIQMQEETYLELALDTEGSSWIDSGVPLLERRLAVFLQQAGTPQSTTQLAEALSVSTQDIGRVLKLILAKGYATKEKQGLVATQTNLDESTPDERLLERLKTQNPLWLSESDAAETTTEDAIKSLRGRSFIKTKPRKQRMVQLEAKGREVLASGVEVIRQVNQLTEAMLLSGEWKQVTFRPYNVHLDTQSVYPGKPHPLRRVLEETRQAFLHMGFTEIRGPYVESAFWDFDALFQPQDHPAREMQDTFYCGRPATFSLPEAQLVETIRRTHEEGGDTGSTGWRYRWSEEKAKQVVLRTHTTAVTVASCHQNPHSPQKLFTVGRVFRRETIDYKHLPEFHQVDGVILDESASFANLLGTLTAFYRQMGFEAVKFRPAFFPYTEPSVEVFVRMPGRKEWFELGGAGVFRPEVTRPAGVSVPVLAWGLGLERLAMIRYNIQDIRELYLSHLDWLRRNPLCS